MEENLFWAKILGRRMKISEKLKVDIIRHCQREAPREACGMLVGFKNEDSEAEAVVKQVYQSENVHEAPETEFKIDPKKQLEVFELLDEDDEIEMVGIYHSHPKGAPCPSNIDKQRMNYPAALYVIALPEKEKIAAWRWLNGKFEKEQIEIV